MPETDPFSRSGLVLGATLMALLVADARAQEASDIGTVVAPGTRINVPPGTAFPAPAPGTPAYVAPSRAPLEASQPTSVVGSNFIDKSAIPAQSYDELVKFTPSVMNIQPAGPVSQQNYG